MALKQDTFSMGSWAKKVEKDRFNLEQCFVFHKLILNICAAKYRWLKILNINFSPQFPVSNDVPLTHQIQHRNCNIFEISVWHHAQWVVFFLKSEFLKNRYTKESLFFSPTEELFTERVHLWLNQRACFLRPAQGAPRGLALWYFL